MAGVCGRSACVEDVGEVRAACAPQCWLVIRFSDFPGASRTQRPTAHVSKWLGPRHCCEGGQRLLRGPLLLAGPGACKANCRGTCAIFSDKVGARCSTGALPSQEDEATFGPSDDVLARARSKPLQGVLRLSSSLKMHGMAATHGMKTAHALTAAHGLAAERWMTAAHWVAANHGQPMGGPQRCSPWGGGSPCGGNNRRGNRTPRCGGNPWGGRSP